MLRLIWIYLLLEVISLQGVEADYRIGFTIFDYSNPGNTLSNGTCCMDDCSGCRTTLRICFRDAQHSHSDVNSECVQLQNRINANPVSFPASTSPDIQQYYPRTFQIYVRVSHSLNEITFEADFDPPFTDPLIDDIFIEANVSAVTFTDRILNEIYTVTGDFGRATLTMTVNVRCSPNYYGEHCEQLCQPGGTNCTTVLTPPANFATTHSPVTVPEHTQTTTSTYTKADTTLGTASMIQPHQDLSWIAAVIVVLVAGGIIFLLCILIGWLVIKKKLTKSVNLGLNTNFAEPESERIHARNRTQSPTDVGDQDSMYENLDIFREQIPTEVNAAYEMHKCGEDDISVTYETIPEQISYSGGLAGAQQFDLVGTGQFKNYHRGLLYHGEEQIRVLMRQLRPNEDIKMKTTLLHPNILQYHGVTLINGSVWVTMEFSESLWNLKAFLSKHHRSSQKLIAYMLDISMALHYIIDKGLLHQDIAARNILICITTEKCKIGEFGQRNSKSEEQMSGISLGAVRWMAPESLLYGQYLPASDVWSFGILMWEMANPTKRPYPEIETNLQCATQVTAGYRMKPPACYPNTVQAVITSAWEKDAAQKPSFADIIKVLQSCLAK